MARKHSKLTVILVDGNDISEFCTDSTCEQSAGTEDNTTYGKNAVVKDPTLLTGAFSCSGKYDSDADGPPRRPEASRRHLRHVRLPSRGHRFRPAAGLVHRRHHQVHRDGAGGRLPHLGPRNRTVRRVGLDRPVLTPGGKPA